MERVEVGGPTPREALEIFAANQRLEAGPIEDVELAGLPAVSMEFTPQTLVQLFGGPEGGLGVDSGRPIRIIAVDVVGVLFFALLISQSETTVGFELGEAVLETVRVS
ncbi:MAG: hypothetical protein WEB00_15845 [Dehalococcoidia bacterium]